MAGSAIKGEIRRFSMATETADPDTANAIQAHAVTKGAGILDITCRVVEGTIRPGPTILRMSIIDAMAAFTALVAGGDDAEIEARVAAGATRLAMAGLADRQVGLGIRTMIGAKEIAAIEWVWCLSRAVRMAALAVKTGRKATGCGLIALQGRAVTSRAGISAVYRRIGTVINISIRPTCWVS